MRMKKPVVFGLIVCFVVFLLPVACAEMVPWGPYNKKTLETGESWAICGGYAITVQAIDAKATPRIVWLVLTKDGLKMDDKVIAQGGWYNYSDDDDNEIFTLMVDAIFSGATSDMVQLKNITINSSLLIHDEARVLNVGEVWEFCGGYSIAPLSINTSSTPKRVRLILRKDGYKMDERVLQEGALYSYGFMFGTKVEAIFPGVTSDMVQLRNTFLNPDALVNFTIPPCDESWSCGPWTSCLNGYYTRTCVDANNCGSVGNKPKSSEDCAMVPIGDGKRTLTTNETWNVCGGYSLTVQSIDATSSPRQVWVVFGKDGVKLEDKVVTEGEAYSYSDVFSTKVESILAGATSDTVQFKNTTISYKLLTRNEKKTLTTGEIWDFCGGYSILPQSIDVSSGTKQVLLVLRKNSVKLNEKMVAQGEWYNYTDILSTKVDTIFAGATSNMVQLANTSTTSTAIIDTTTPICAESWSCEGWSKCEDGQETRNCKDENKCGTAVRKPPTTQKCAAPKPTCTESWTCGSWSSCANGKQTRNCTDANECGVERNKPETTQNCGARDNETTTGTGATGTGGGKLCGLFYALLGLLGFVLLRR